MNENQNTKKVVEEHLYNPNQVMQYFSAGIMLGIVATALSAILIIKNKG